MSQMRELNCSIHTTDYFDMNASLIVPKSEVNLAAIWCFCSSPQYNSEVRKIDQALKVTTGTLVKVPFDLPYWKAEAARRYPNGLPKPYSDDPTQWLFHGHPAFATGGTELHVALARLAGYQWPAEIDVTVSVSDLAREQIILAAKLPQADADGLLPLHEGGEKLSLADRMRAMLAAAYGSPLSNLQEKALVRAADRRFDKKETKDATMEGWLADRAFRQHCILFNQRPFIWQIWDGMKGGFSAFFHYHRLDRAALDKLTYTLLGDWIRAAKGEGQSARLERAERLQQVLANIIKGESPFDIFVRWKTLADQPIGWNPDLYDGVRVNIRPFMTAEILREQPKGVSWTKDRGTDVPTAPWSHLGPRCGGKNGDRINDHHITLAEKRAAQQLAAE